MIKAEEEGQDEDEVRKGAMCDAFSYFMQSSDYMSKSPSPPSTLVERGAGG